MNGKRFMIGGWVVILGMHQHLQSMEKWPPQEHENKQVAPSNNNQVVALRDMRFADMQHTIMSDAELQQRAYPLFPRSFLRLETLKAQLVGQDQSAKNEAEQELDGIINANKNRSLACVASKIRAREHIQNAQYAQAERLLENKEFQAHDPEVSYLKALIQLGVDKREDALNLLAEASQPYTVQGVGENIKHVIYKPAQDLYKQLSSNGNVIWQKDIAQWTQTLDGNSLVRFTPAVRLATFKNAAAGENPQALTDLLGYVNGLSLAVRTKHGGAIQSTIDIFKAQATENPQIAYALSTVYGKGIPGVVEIDQKKKEELFQLALQKNHAKALFEVKSAESKPLWYEFLGKTGSEKGNLEVAELRKKVWRMLDEQASKSLLSAYDAAYAHLHYDEGDKSKGVAFFQAAHKMELEADDDVAAIDLRKRAFQAMKSLAKEDTSAREVLFDAICSVLEREKCFETHESDLATACSLYENMKLCKINRLADAERLASLHCARARKLIQDVSFFGPKDSLRNKAEKLLSKAVEISPDDTGSAIMLAKLLIWRSEGQEDDKRLKRVVALFKRMVDTHSYEGILAMMSVVQSVPFLVFTQQDMPAIDDVLKNNFSKAPATLLWLRFLATKGIAMLKNANDNSANPLIDLPSFQMSKDEIGAAIDKAQLNDQEKKYAQALFYYLHNENQKADLLLNGLELRFQNNLMPFKIVEKLKNGEACKDLFDAYLMHVQKENGEPFTKSFFSEKPLSDSLLGCKYLLMQVDKLLEGHDNNNDGGNLVISQLHLHRVLSFFRAPQVDLICAHGFFATLEKIFGDTQKPAGNFLQALIKESAIFDFAQKYASNNPLYQVVYMHLKFYSLSSTLEQIRVQENFNNYQQNLKECIQNISSGIGKLSEPASSFAQQIKSDQYLKFFKSKSEKLSENDRLELLEKMNDDSPSRATILLYIEQLALTLKQKNNVLIIKKQAGVQKLVSWMKKAAHISDDDKLFIAQLWCGQAGLKVNDQTIVIERQPEIGQKMLHELSEKGSWRASERLADFYSADPKKCDMAIEFYKKAFEQALDQGLTRGHTEVAEACCKKKNYEQAFNFLQLTQKDESFVRLYKLLNLAHFYKDGLGTKKSDDEFAHCMAKYYLTRLGMSAEKQKSLSTQDEAKLKEIIDKNQLCQKVIGLSLKNDLVATMAFKYMQLYNFHAENSGSSRHDKQQAVNKDLARLALETTIPDDLRRNLPIAMLLTLLDGTAQGAISALEKLAELFQHTSAQEIKDAPVFLFDVQKKIYESAQKTCNADEQICQKASALIEKINERVDEIQKLINQEKEVDTKKSGKDEVL